MAKRERHDFSYNDILRREGPSPAMMLVDEVEHRCECGAIYMGTRPSKWCPACRPAATARSQQRSLAKQKAKRAAARANRAPVVRMGRKEARVK